MRILAISAHPDDETLGAGGTLLKHKSEGDQLFWLIATQAQGKEWSLETREKKSLEVERVAKAYEMTQQIQLDFPAARLEATPQTELIEKIRKVIWDVNPEIIYLVHEGDVHSDHRAVYHATFSALKAFSMKKSSVRKILCWETPSSTDAGPPRQHSAFVPNLYQEITPFIEKKIEIMGLYETEGQDDPLPRGRSALRALARYRGATVGVEYAEAFMLIRELR